MKRITIILSFLALPACGGVSTASDDPDNIPLAGQWSDSRRILSVQFNGAATDRSKIPGLPADAEAQSCQEPKMRSSEDLKSVMLQTGKLKDCNAPTVTRIGNRAVLRGMCNGVEVPGIDPVGSSALFTGTAVESANHIRLDYQVDMTLREKSGNGAQFRIIGSREMKRLGDC